MNIKWARLVSASLYDFKWEYENYAMNLLTVLRSNPFV